MNLKSSLGAAIIAAALHIASTASGATLVGTHLFRDTFDRLNNNDIDAVTTGITNNTGTSFGPSTVYSQPWINPNSV
jgi:hypothetical protein